MRLREVGSGLIGFITAAVNAIVATIEWRERNTEIADLRERVARLEERMNANQ